jgi:hypothetical protein
MEALQPAPAAVAARLVQLSSAQLSSALYGDSLLLLLLPKLELLLFLLYNHKRRAICSHLNGFGL